MRAHRIGLAVATGVLAMVGLAACGGASDQAAGTSVAASDTADIPEYLSADGQALATIGFSPQDLVTEVSDPTQDANPQDTATAANPNPGSSASNGDKNNRRRTLRRIALKRNVLHGDFTVRTKQGDKLVAVQRGTVQSVDATSITVKSADGVTQTWARDSQLRVVKNRAKADASAITVGAEIGIAGVKNGETRQARLVVIPAK